MLDGQIAQNLVVNVYTVTGCLQIQKQIVENETILQAKNLKSGMYIVNVSGNGTSSTHKVVIR